MWHGVGDTLWIDDQSGTIAPRVRFRLNRSIWMYTYNPFQGCLRSGANPIYDKVGTGVRNSPLHGCRPFHPFAEAGGRFKHVDVCGPCMSLSPDRKIVACGIGLWRRTPPPCAVFGTPTPSMYALKRPSGYGRCGMVWCVVWGCYSPKEVSISSPPPARKPSGEAGGA